MKKLILYEIQHHTVVKGWVNTWSDGKGRAVHFSTYREAELALQEFFLDLRDSVTAGEILPYSDDEFRVREIPHNSRSLKPGIGRSRSL